MKRKSTKQRELETETHALRYASIEYGCECDCGCGQFAQDAHEIPAGSGRRCQAMKDANAQLRLARMCHEEWQGKPPAEQVALKVRAIVRAVNKAWGWNRIGVDDVIEALGDSL